MTAEQVKEKFRREGKTFSQWAKENNFSYRTVVAVLNGTNKMKYGQSHNVGVALGLKETN